MNRSKPIQADAALASVRLATYYPLTPLKPQLFRRLLSFRMLRPTPLQDEELSHVNITRQRILRLTKPCTIC